MQRSFGACCRVAACSSISARACKCKSFVEQCCMFQSARHASALSEAAAFKPRPAVISQPTVVAAAVPGSVPAATTAAPIEVYMRELPPSCIDWSTDGELRALLMLVSALPSKPTGAFACRRSKSFPRGAASRKHGVLLSAGSAVHHAGGTRLLRPRDTRNGFECAQY